MTKAVVVINGKGGVGKDTLCDIVSQKHMIVNVSSITLIKQVASELGWNPNDKSDKARRFLSDLKLLATEYNDAPFKYLLDRYNAFIRDATSEIMFVHIREPKEIEKFKSKTGCKTLLVRSNRIKDTFGNMADDNVEHYSYDYIYRNDRPLEEVEGDFLDFFERNLLP